MKDLIVLELKVQDFINTSYLDSCDCAIAKAIKRQLNVTTVVEEVDRVSIMVNNKQIYYKHSDYSYDHYKIDKQTAMLLKKDSLNTVIAMIELTKIN